MITHCPFCQTHFRVYAEQLAVRAGQVRCGKCSRVFDALEHLTEELVSAREPTPTPAVIASAQLVPGSIPGEPVWSEPADGDGLAETAQAGVEMSVAAMPGPEPEPALTPAQPVVVDRGGAYDADAFDFGPIAAADPARRARRWPWVLGAFLLLLVLLVQALYYYRSAVIVLFPKVKPYAVELCARLGCELPLLRRIEQISIEASDLQADTTNPNVMVLSATLKNRAAFAQQLPGLELTLTNAQDLPVVRRVLTAQDYLGKAAGIQAGFAANSEIAIKVYIEASQVKATGYRLYLFYP